jgi:hypothetical protein
VLRVKVRVSQDVILCLLAEALLASCGWVSGASKFVHGPGDFLVLPRRVTGIQTLFTEAQVGA